MTATLFETPADHPRGVVLVSHGLNTRPDVMDDLIGVLVAQGFHCQRISLYRDGPTRRASPSAIVDGWLGAVGEAHAEAARRYPGLPLHCLGFSIGALVSIRYLDLQPTPPFQRAFLLAPPVALTRPARLVRALTPLRRLGAVLPSAAPRAVRARRGTPLAEYAALLETIAAVEHLSHAEDLAAVPTRVVLDERDELVSLPGVARWMHANGLRSWTVEPLADRRSAGRTYKHLIVLKDAIGSTAWTRLTGAIVAHFAQVG